MSSSSRTGWVIAAVAGTIVVLNVAVALVRHYTPNPGGPTSSSYATAAGGLAAYATLLARNGHPVTQIREEVAHASLDPRTTVVLLDPRRVRRADATALRRFVERGGRLVAGGSERLRWLGELLRRPPKWTSDGLSRARPLARVPETEGVSHVVAARGGSWARRGDAKPALGAGGRSLLLVARAGRGRVALLADASPLQNRLLARADDAELGLALAGGRPVAFVESVHGYGRATGVAAIPHSWLVAFAGLGLAALLLIWARGRRLGPPEDEERQLPPPRREYVDALAGLLERSRDPAAAVAPVQAEVRRRLAQQGGAAPGLSDAEVEAALAPVRQPADVLAAGRALARLERGRVRVRGGGA